MKKIIAEYRIELLALLAALAGVFLLVEQIPIRQMLSDFVKGLLNTGRQAAGSAATGVSNYLNTFSPSDLLGWIILFAVATFVIWRVRYRFVHTEHWKATVCPRCGSEIHRSRRNPVDRFLSWSLLPGARRYRCHNDSCEWEGLRRRRPHSKPQETGE